jgi:VWFA-related protein
MGLQVDRWRWLAATALLCILVGRVAGEPAPRIRVAVVAVHDSRLLTLCPVVGQHVAVADIGVSGRGVDVTVTRGPSGFQSINLLESNRMGVLLPLPEPQEGLQSDEPLERLAVDAEVRRLVEAQFRKRGRYSVAESLDQADLVFIVESYYLPLALGTARFPARPRPPVVPLTKPTAERIFSETENEWARRQWNYDSVPSPKSPRSPGPTFEFGLVAPDEWAPGWRQASVAIVVPAAIYTEHKGRGGELASGRLWQGLATAQMPTERPRRPGEGPSQVVATKPASPEELVDQFHGRGFKLPHYLPVCGATTGLLRDLADPSGAALDESAPFPIREGGLAPTASAGAQFRSNITLVSVPVTVAWRDGRPADDLRAAEFHVFEDGVEQHIDSVESGKTPTDVAFLVDASSSMRGALAQIRSASRLIGSEIRASDRVAVVAFGSRVLLRSGFTTNRERLGVTLEELRATGGTRLYDAIALAATDVLNPTAPRSAIILFTDGVDTESRLADAAGALAAISASNVEVHVVLCPFGGRSPIAPSVAIAGQVVQGTPAVSGATVAGQERSLAFLDQLVARTGGTRHVVGSSADLRTAVAEVILSLSQQYVLRYYPRNSSLDGRYRSLRVTVDRPVDIQHARDGYLAGVLQLSR